MINYKIIVGGIIAYILLILYSGIAAYIIVSVIGFSRHNPEGNLELHPGITYILTTVGGLVSALVVSRLTITTPGADPAVFSHFGREQPPLVNFIVWCYLIIWILTGIASLVTGVVIYPDTCKTLSDFGTTWLGLAVAAGYAYFNIDPR